MKTIDLSTNRHKKVAFFEESAQKKDAQHELCVREVVLPGFEPGQAEPKPAVLPLHHKTILTS